MAKLGYGLSVKQIIRENLMLELGLNHKEAEKVSQKIEDQFNAERCLWIQTNCRQFNLTWEHKK